MKYAKGNTNLFDFQFVEAKLKQLVVYTGHCIPKHWFYFNNIGRIFGKQCGWAKWLLILITSLTLFAIFA